MISLRSPATAAGLHAAAPGLRGPVIATIDFTPGASGNIRTEIMPSEVQPGYIGDDRL